MADRIWDPYRVLSIANRDSNMMYCVGRVQRHPGSRCRWDIPNEKFNQIRLILRSMETRPPSEAYNFLSQLAWLGLCSQYHQNQTYSVEMEWRAAVDDAVRDYERLDMLTRRNAELSALLNNLDSQLAAARDHSDQYRSNYTEAERTRAELATVVDEQRAKMNELEQTKSSLTVQTLELSNQLASERQVLDEYMTSAQASQANLSGIINSLEAELNSGREVSLQRQNALEELKVERDALNTSANDFQFQLTAQHNTSQQLKRDLDEARATGTESLEQIETLRTQLSSERKNAEQLTKNLAEADTTRTVIAEELEDVRKKLEIEIHNSEEYKKTLNEAEAGKAVLIEELGNVRARLEIKLQNTEQPKSTPGELDTSQTVFIEERENLRANLAAERQNSEQLKKTLDEVNKEQAVLLEEIEKVRSELDIERKNTERLSNELSASKTQEAALSAQLEEQKAAAAAANTASSAESARLQEQINQLQKSSIGTLLSTLCCFWRRRREAEQDSPG